MHLASLTPGVVVLLPLQQQEILVWQARVAPSATLLFASQSNCSKHRKRETWLAVLLISRV